MNGFRLLALLTMLAGSAWADKVVRVGGMSESPYGTRTLETIQREGLGDYTVLFVGPWTAEKIRRVGEFCRKNNMRFVMDETVSRRQVRQLRGTYAKIAKASIAAATEYIDVDEGNVSHPVRRNHKE